MDDDISYTYDGIIDVASHRPTPVRCHGKVWAPDIHEAVLLISRRHNKHPFEWHESCVTVTQTGEIVYYKDSAMTKAHMKLALKAPPVFSVPPVPVGQALRDQFIAKTVDVTPPPPPKDPRFVRNGWRKTYKVLKA